MKQFLLLRPIVDHLRRAALRPLSVSMLFARFRATRDEAALAELVARTTVRLQAHCRPYLQDRDEIDEVVQEVFSLLVERADAIRDENSVDAWLDQTAVNVARNHSRRQARRTPQPLSAEALELHDPTPGPELLAELREQYAAVLAEIDRLNEDWKRAFTLRLLEERPYAEVAAILGASLDKVKQDVSRARKQLRTRLVRKGIVLPTALAGVLFGKAAHSHAAMAALALLSAVLVLGAVFVAVQLPPKPEATGSVSEQVETLPERNQKVFLRDVLPRLTTALQKLTLGEGGSVTITRLEGCGSRVFCEADLRHAPPFARTSKLRLIVDTHTGRKAVRADVWGTGGPLKHLEFNRPIILWEHGPSLPLEGLTEAAAALDAMPKDPRAGEESARYLDKLRRAALPYCGEWCRRGDPAKIAVIRWVSDSPYPLRLRLTPEQNETMYDLFPVWVTADGQLGGWDANFSRVVLSPDDNRLDFPDTRDWWVRKPGS